MKPVRRQLPQSHSDKIRFRQGGRGAPAPQCFCLQGRVRRGGEARPSPEWLQRRLKAVGLQPFDALVDAPTTSPMTTASRSTSMTPTDLTSAIHARDSAQGQVLRSAQRQDLRRRRRHVRHRRRRESAGFGRVISSRETGSTEEATTNMSSSPPISMEDHQHTPAASSTFGRIVTTIRAPASTQAFFVAWARACDAHGAQRRAAPSKVDRRQAAEGECAFAFDPKLEYGEAVERPRAGRTAGQTSARCARRRAGGGQGLELAEQHLLAAPGDYCRTSQSWYEEVVRLHQHGSHTRRRRCPLCRRGPPGAWHDAIADAARAHMLAARGLVEAVTWWFGPRRGGGRSCLEAAQQS